MASDAAVEAAGGAVGSSIALAVTYPLAIVSTWQALEHEKRGVDTADPELQAKYRLFPSPLRELCIFTESRGFRSLFAGLKPCLAATAISQAVYFYLYSTLRQAIVARKLRAQAAAAAGPHGHGRAPGPAAAAANARTEDIGVLGSLLVAGLAGCGNVLATNPVWVVATQLQAMQRRTDPQERSRSAWGVAVQLYRESGVTAFWKGVLPSLVMVANPTLQYILYEWFTARLLELRRARAGGKRVTLGALDVFLLTALGKLGATLVTYPMLLIKSRLQAMNASTVREARYSGVRDAVLAIAAREGVGAFYKGMRLKMFQTVLAAALLMSIKEQVYGSTRALLSGGGRAKAAG